MVFSKLRQLFGAAPPPRTHRWQHLSLADRPDAIFVIGDIHGCLNELVDLEKQIAEDASSIGGTSWVIYLGDYLDRGPDSAGVIDRLLDPAPGALRRLCLAGNHEAMALDFFATPRANADWLRFGGEATLASYGISPATLQNASPRSLVDLVHSHIPQEHIEFLENLHLTISVPGLLFVHAGIRPGQSLERQIENDLLWIRDEFFAAEAEPGRVVVHGHTPAAAVLQVPGRICVDTGAYATGILSAVRLMPNGDVKILTSAKLR